MAPEYEYSGATVRSLITSTFFLFLYFFFFACLLSVLTVFVTYGSGLQILSFGMNLIYMRISRILGVRPLQVTC
ncbi:hypothetical protein SSAG_04845 [Streptomyces sp. Mg1]|nr:hypothetical protein SSAG_04845 [Streptomyces sp. Mg1]